jgi:16S rRNA (cytosine967-C5)-methyltransferase
VSERAAGPRRAAYEVLRGVFEHGAWADRAFPAAAERHRLDPRERAQAQRLAYGAVQRRGTADHLIEQLAARPVEKLDPPVLAALRLGMFELLWSRRVPDHAAVDQAVELAKWGGGRRHRGQRRRAEAGAGAANAILRRAVRERAKLLAGIDDSTPDGAAVLHSYPRWLASMWWREVGPDDARSLMKAFNEPAETALRVNTIRADPASLRDRLSDDEEVKLPPGPGPLLPPEALVVRGRLGEEARRAIAAGEAVSQSRGSQAVVALLDPRPRERILELCAAPGLKTSAIAARIQNTGEIVSVELDPGRAARMRQLCERLGVECVQLVEGDAARADVGDGYDRILVDPPCSDLGTLASRPDARWRKSPAQILQLASVQGGILEHAAPRLRPGGTLVYSTCTISRRENEDLVARLLGSNPELGVDDLGADHPELASRLDPRCLQTRPDRDRTDGFFIARLRRSATPAGG